MKILCKLQRSPTEKGEAFDIQVTIQNDSQQKVMFELGKFLLSAERAALDIRAPGGQRLEPVEYQIINPAGEPAIQALEPGEQCRVDLQGKLVSKTAEVTALVFPHATYRLEKGREYSLRLCWGVVASDPLIFVAE